MGACASVESTGPRPVWSFGDFKAPVTTRLGSGQSTRPTPASVQMVFEELNGDDVCDQHTGPVPPPPRPPSSAGGVTAASRPASSGWSESNRTASGSRELPKLSGRNSSLGASLPRDGSLSRTGSGTRPGGAALPRRSMPLEEVHAYPLPLAARSPSMRQQTQAQAQAQRPSRLAGQAQEVIKDGGASVAALRMARWGAFPAAACDLAVEGEVLGGGRAVVFKGHWHNTPVAVKILDTRGSEIEAAHHATEMALMSSVHHPHLVEALACFTDLVAGDAPDCCGNTSVLSLASAIHPPRAPAAARSGDGAAPAPTPPPLRYLRRLLAGEEPEGPVYNVIVSALCNAGTLRAALDSGALPAVGAAAAGAPLDLPTATELLVGVASGLAQLHGMHMAHGDVRAENILLTTSSAHPVGVMAKLGGFGSAAILDQEGNELDLVATLPSADGSAAPAVHLARTYSLPSQAKTRAADVAAFGEVLHEVVARVGRHCAADCSMLASLAAACCDEEPPSMEDAVSILSHLATSQRALWRLQA